jgi:hypothetical protein
MPDANSRLEALSKLAPHLPTFQQHLLLAEALAAARALRDESNRAGVLMALAPHLPEPLLAEALAAARALREEGNCAVVLAALAPHLPELVGWGEERTPTFSGQGLRWDSFVIPTYGPEAEKLDTGLETPLPEETDEWWKS